MNTFSISGSWGSGCAYPGGRAWWASHQQGEARAARGDRQFCCRITVRMGNEHSIKWHMHFEDTVADLKALIRLEEGASPPICI